MDIGIFTKTFKKDSLEDVLDAVRQRGLLNVQFNMSSAGLESMPDVIEKGLISRIKKETEERGLSINAVSGTFNMVHPDEKVRAEGLRRLKVLASACSGIGTSVISLCTGTKDETSMWKFHPDNCTKEAWTDLCRTMSAALEIAQEFGITMAIEPEISNVVDSAVKAKLLLGEMKTENLKVIMDAANLFRPQDYLKMEYMLEQAFGLLGENIVLAHAKDFIAEPEFGFTAAGLGVLDYRIYLKLLAKHGYTGAVILHGLSEPQVDDSVKFLNERFTELQKDKRYADF